MVSSGRHVAVVVPSLTRAGAERVAETLAREFVRSCRVTIITTDPRLSRREVQDLASLPWSDRIPPGCRHLHLPAPGSGLSRLLPLVVRFARVARRERFDAVFSFLTWTNVLVAASRSLGGHYVHIASEHALAESLRDDGGQLRTLARALPWIYRRPDRLVVVSNAVRRSLWSAGLLPRPDRAVIIANPIDAAGIRQLAAAPFHLVLPPDDAVVLVCVGRLHEQKDHLTLLRAFVRLPDRYQLFLVGDGPLRQELERDVSRLGLADRVHFTGVLANPYPMMSLADAVVLPSREEGFGLVAAEAAVLGVPFVGSDVGGLAEVCALLGHKTFPVEDDAALAATLTALGRRTRATDDSAAAVERLFDPATIAAQYLDLVPPGAGGRFSRG